MGYHIIEWDQADGSLAPRTAQLSKMVTQQIGAKITEVHGLWAHRELVSLLVNNKKRSPLLSSTTGAALQIYKGLLSVYSGHHKLKTFAAYSQNVNARFVGFERYVCFSVSICTAALQ